MSILFLLKEHGELTFEQLEDIMGSSIDTVDLMTRLNVLESEGLIKSYISDSELITYKINA